MQKKAFLMIIAAGMMWGTSGIFAHALAPYGFSALQMTAFRGFVAFVCIALYALFFGRSLFRVKPKTLLLYFLIGVCLFLCAYLYYLGMQLTSVSTAVVLMYLAPIYVLLYSVIFFKEKVSVLKGVSVAAMLGGCVLVSGVLGGIKADLVGLLCGIGAGVIYAVYNILTKISMARGDNPASATIYGFLSISLISLPICNLPEAFGFIAADTTSIFWLIGLGVVTFVIPYFLYTLSLRSLAAGTAASLAVVEPMSATLFSVLLLGETLTPFSICGIILVLAAVVMLGIDTGRTSA